MSLNHSPTAIRLSALALAFAICLSMALALTLSSDKARAQGVDIDAVFNCSADGPIGTQTPEQCLSARNSVLSYCTSCHTFVPVVKAQKSPDGWDALLAAHRENVPEMSEAQYDEMRDFLKSHYNETEPVPILPPALENLGTNEAA